VTPRLELVTTVARGLAEGVPLRVAVTEDQWAWQPGTGTLFVGQRHLAELPLDVCLGLVAHEIGHCAVTRYLGLAAAWQPPGLPAQMWLDMLNILEEARVETFAARHFPGTAAWLRALNAADIRGLWPLPDELPFSHMVLRAHLGEWAQGWQPVPDLPPPVAEMLDATRPLRRTLAETLPVLAGVPLAEREPLVLGSALHAMPHAARFGGLMARMRADEIDHLAAALAAHDSARAMAERAVGLASAQWAWATLRRVQESTRVQPPSVHDRRLATDLRGLIDRAEQAKKDAAMALQRRQKRSPRGASPGHCPPATKRSRSAPVALPPVERLLTALRTALGRVFPPEADRTWTRDHPTGSRLDLRRALQLQADPAAAAQLWQRRAAPTRPDAEVLLLVDLSGSMNAEGKADAAVLASSACAQVLREWGIPCAILGFQDEVIPIADFAEPWSPQLARRIADMALEVVGERPDGHNRPGANYDGPCLLEAAAQLRRRSATTRVLVVISDGRPSFRAGGAAGLHDAVAEVQRSGGIALVAIGIGPGTAHVEQFYPDAQGEVTVADFPAVLTAALVKRLGSGGRGGGRQAVAG